MTAAAGEDPGGSPARTKAPPPKVRRVLLAVFLCGLAACAMVTAIGSATLFGLRALDEIVLTGESQTLDLDTPPLMRGALIAGLAAAINWAVFYLTIPAAWVAIWLSLGRFPRRGILHGAPYRRWGTIFGAGLVALPTLFGAAAFSGDASERGTVLLGAGLVALPLGALAGLACAGLFLAIVRPMRQVQRMDAAVF